MMWRSKFKKNPKTGGKDALKKLSLATKTPCIPRKECEKRIVTTY